MTGQKLPVSPAGTRTSPRIKAKRHTRTSNDGKPEIEAARANRKRKAATARAKAAASNKRTKPKATGVREIPKVTGVQESQKKSGAQKIPTDKNT